TSTPSSKDLAHIVSTSHGPTKSSSSAPSNTKTAMRVVTAQAYALGSLGAHETRGTGHVQVDRGRNGFLADRRGGREPSEVARQELQRHPSRRHGIQARHGRQH